MILMNKIFSNLLNRLKIPLMISYTLFTDYFKTMYKGSYKSLIKNKLITNCISIHILKKHPGTYLT